MLLKSWRRVVHLDRYIKGCIKGAKRLAVSEARRLRELEAENSKLKRLLAEAELEKAALKDLLNRKW